MVPSRSPRGKLDDDELAIAAREQDIDTRRSFPTLMVSMRAPEGSSIGAAAKDCEGALPGPLGDSRPEITMTRTVNPARIITAMTTTRIFSPRTGSASLFSTESGGHAC